MLRALLLSVVVGGCGASSTRLAETRLPPEAVKDGEARPPAGPKYSPEPGRQALREAVLACYNLGLGHNREVFARGGAVVVRWAADRAGDLLSLDFTQDSFSGWEVDGKQTFADCVTGRVEQSQVLWSAEGTAPFRLAPEAE